jgi:hypothetical protein
MFIYEVFLLLMGPGSVGLGVWLLFKDKYRVSFLLIGLGLLCLGWFWFLAMGVGILILFFLVTLTRIECRRNLKKYLKREEEPPSNMRSVHTHEKNESNFKVWRWLKK